MKTHLYEAEAECLTLGSRGHRAWCLRLKAHIGLIT